MGGGALQCTARVMREKRFLGGQREYGEITNVIKLHQGAHLKIDFQRRWLNWDGKGPEIAARISMYKSIFAFTSSCSALLFDEFEDQRSWERLDLVGSGKGGDVVHTKEEWTCRIVVPS